MVETINETYFDNTFIFNNHGNDTRLSLGD